MIKRFYILLLAIVASVGMSWATVITWDQTKVSTTMAMNVSSGSDSRTSDGITVTAVSTGEFVVFGDHGGAIEIGNGEGSGGGYITFESSVGNITQIDINHSGAGEWRNANGDWISPYYENFEGGIFTWSGTPAASVTLTGDAPRHIDDITSIEFTIEDGGGSTTDPIVIATNTEQSSYTQGSITVSVNYVGDSDGFRLNDDNSASISNSGSSTISKIELVPGWFLNKHSYVRANGAEPNSSSEELITFLNVNSNEVTLSCSVSICIKEVRIYFGEAGGGSEPATGLQVVEVTSDLYDGWKSNSNPFTVNALPGFKAVTFDEAKEWTGVPTSGTAVLVYRTNGDNARVIQFFDGTITDDYDIETDFNQIYENITIFGNRYFYTVGGGSPAPANSCGGGLTWELNNGELVISYDGKGTGVMNDYDIPNDNLAPWYANRENITSVSLPEGIKTIGKDAFRDCVNLTTVTIPNSVTTIGESAFVTVEHLETVTIGTGITSIVNGAFYGNAELTTVTCSATTPPSIGMMVFGSCPNLEHIYVPAESVDAYKTAWSDYASIISAAGGGSTPTVTWNSSNVSDLQVNGNSYSKEGITLSPNASNNYAYWLDYGNESQNGIAFYANATGGHTFSNSLGKNFTKIEMTLNGSTGWYVAYLGSGWNIDGMKVIWTGNASTVDLLTETSDFGGAATVKSIVFYFEGGSEEPAPANSCGDGLTWELNGGVLTISYDGVGTGEMTDFDYEYDESPVNVAPWKENKSEITTVIVGDGVKSIGNYAFNDLYENFTAVTIANSVERIGLNAFMNAKWITEITLPSSLKTIDKECFAANFGFTSITIPSGVTSIGNKAFCYCTGLTSLTCEATTPPTLGSSVFYKITSKTSDMSNIPLYVPSESVAAYEAAAQWNAFDVQAIPGGGSTPANSCGDGVIWELNNGALTISYTGTGTGVMDNYASLSDAPWYSHKDDITSVTITDGVKSVGSYSFGYYGNLVTVTIGNDVETIGYYAFGDCYKFTTLNLGNSVKHIGDRAFMWAKVLTGFTLPSTLETIGERAFLQNKLITSLTIPSNVTSIGESAFMYCAALTSVTVEATTPPTLGATVFEGVPTSSIPLHVPSGSVAAYTAADQWKDFDIQDPTPAYEKVMNLINEIGTVELTAECKAKIDAARAAYDALSDGDKAQVTNIATLTTAEAAFDNVMDIWLSGDCDAILWKDTTLTIRKHAGEGNGAMADYTDYYGDNTAPWFNSHWYNPQPGDIVIKSVTIEEGVTHIGENAFGWMSELKTITIPSSMTSIGEDAFYWSKAVDDIYLTADPSNLTWVLPYSADNQFKPEKATLCHVPADLLTAYQETFGTLNMTFVGDLAPVDPAAGAAAIVDLINAIGTVEYTDECKAKIDAAREAYDKAVDAVKDLISADDLKKLTDAETEYADLKAAADQAAAAPVIAKINELPNPMTEADLKLSIYDKVTGAREAYDALTADQKALVGNYSILTAAEAAFAPYVGGGTGVEGLLTTITVSNSVVNHSVENIVDINQDAAVLGENGWTSGKVVVSAKPGFTITKVESFQNDGWIGAVDEDTSSPFEVSITNGMTLTKLNVYGYEALSPIAQAQAALALINAIPNPVTLDEACVKAIKDARAAVDALGENAKLIDAADMTKLTDAEKALKDLNQAEADKVIAKINNIPTPVELKLATRDSIQNARAAYDALNAAQQALVTNYQKLLDAEDALADLVPTPTPVPVTPTVWDMNSLKVGDIIYEGDQLTNMSSPRYINNVETIHDDKCPYTLMKSAGETSYVLRDKDGSYLFTDGSLAITPKSVGLLVTNVVSGDINVVVYSLANVLDSAQAVKDLIDAIPTPVEYPTSGPAIAAALVAYNQLSDAAKGALDAADVQKMTDAAAQYAALDAIAAIEAIPAEIVYDPAVKAAIETARDKYDALIDASKALVPEDKVQKLTNALEAWAILVAKIEHNVSYIGKDGELKHETVALLHIPDPAPEFNGYEFVRWDVKAGDFLEEGLRIKAVYTPIITTNPVAYDTLVYNGTAQTLITAGVAKEGHIEYRINDGEWSAELPKATFAAAYVVYYKLVREGHADYIADPINVTIAKAPVTYTAPVAYDTLAYTASNQTLIAAGQTNDGTFEYSLDPTLLDSWKTELPQAMSAGTHNVYYRVQGDLNHLDSTAVDPIAVTIAKAPLTATADDKSIIYGDLAPEFTVTYAGWQGTEGASVLTGEIAYACEYVKGNPVGEYVITPSGVDAANYTITFVNGKLTVNSKSAKSDDITAKQADNEKLVYDAAANKPTIQAKDTTKTLVEDTDYKLTFIGRGDTEYAESATAPAHVGEYTAIVAFIGNYTDTLTVDFVINKAPLTITADDKEVTFGEFAPEFTVSYEGWQGNDTATVLTGSQAYACDYVRGNQIGDYTIIPSGVDAHDYAITFVNGTLTVNRKSAKSADIAAKQADNEKLVYDAEANRPTIQVKDTTLVLTEAQDYVLTFMGVAADQTPYAESETAPTHVGDYTAIVAFIGNYIDTLTVDFTINKAPLTITANDTAMIYGDVAPAFTVSYNGWFGNDDESVILGTQAYDCVYAPGSPIGTYAITPKGVEAYDYAITFVDGTLTVNKAHVYVSDAEAQIAKFADGHANAVVLEQGILNGIKLNDPIAHVTTAAFSSADVAENLTITLFYELTGDAALLNNYHLDPTSDIFTNEGVIIEPFIPNDEHQPEEGEQVEVEEGIDVYAYGYCDGSGYSLKYHLNSGNPDQYKIDFADSRFTNVDWTDLVTTGKEGTIDIEIPVDLPTGDYSMTVYFRDSRFDWLESRALNVTFHVNLPETFVVPLFENTIALVDTCECFTDIQWYFRSDSSEPWQPIPGATGHYYHVNGKLTGEYFVSAKMNGMPTYTCGQDDMETLYGSDAPKAQVKVFPNPVVTTTTVVIENSANYEHNLRIVNLMGVEMKNTTFEGNETIVDMNGYITGNYMISVDGIVVKVMKK